LAAATAVAVLIFFIITPPVSRKMGSQMAPETPMDASTKPMAPEPMASAPLQVESEAPARGAVKLKEPLPAPPVKSTAGMAETTDQAAAPPVRLIEMQLYVAPPQNRTTAAGAASPPSGVQATADKGQDERRRLGERSAHMREMRPAPPRKKAAPAPQEEAPPETAVDLVRRMVAETGGTTGLQKRESASRQDVLMIEIPAGSYARLHSRLSSLGALEAPPPGTEGQGPVRIRLGLISGE
jgi:hypothetical protein